MIFRRRRCPDTTFVHLAPLVHTGYEPPTPTTEDVLRQQLADARRELARATDLLARFAGVASCPHGTVVLDLDPIHEFLNSRRTHETRQHAAGRGCRCAGPDRVVAHERRPA